MHREYLLEEILTGITQHQHGQELPQAAIIGHVALLAQTLADVVLQMNGGRLEGFDQLMKVKLMATFDKMMEGAQQQPPVAYVKGLTDEVLDNALVPKISEAAKVIDIDDVLSLNT